MPIIGEKHKTTSLLPVLIATCRRASEDSGDKERGPLRKHIRSLALALALLPAASLPAAASAQSLLEPTFGTIPAMSPAD
jgi:hypothetical protein